MREHVERTGRVVCDESGDDALEHRNAKRACDAAPDGARVNAVAPETDPDAHRAKIRARCEKKSPPDGYTEVTVFAGFENLEKKPALLKY